MEARQEVSRVRTLSDQELLAGLSGVLGSSRKLLASLVAHLAEVEERRLHLHAGHGTLFAYCTDRLGMSEDEAYRRIEVARLARHFPILFEHLAAGRISLSVAALLKPHLTEVNHVALLDAVGGKTVKQAREVLATWFPRPDVAPSIRKLPQRTAHGVGSSGETRERSEAPLLHGLGDAAGRPRCADAPVVTAETHVATSGSFTEREPTVRHAASEQPAALESAPAPPRTNRTSSKLEPLAPERYKVVFTADADLKRKLDLARDLLRHALPNGDLAEVIGRAVDLLLEKTLQRRFAKATRTPRSPATTAEVATTSLAGASIAGPRPTSVHDTNVPPRPSPATPAVTPTPEKRTGQPRHLPSRTRRAVLERDGLCCTWIGPDGARCESRAWLEYDHIVPRGLGGDDDPANLRMRCRAHNRLAAEQAYGQPAITHIIARCRARKEAASQT